MLNFTSAAKILGHLSVDFIKFYWKLIYDVDGIDSDGILVECDLYWALDEIVVCRVDVEHMRNISKYRDWKQN